MTLDYFYGQAGELFSFYRIPKALFQEPRFQSLSTDAKTLYGILLDRMSLSAKNGWLDEQGRVFIMTDIPQKFLNAGCDVYMVMQLRHDEKILDERFASMRELHRRGKTPDPEHYEVTYYADLPVMWQDVPDNEVLEELFQMFNLSRPQDFEGHSLSVSDVIALKRNGEVSVHYVDSIGFKDLQGFLDKQPERPSVLMNLKEKCDAPECNPTVCRKVRDAHEL